MGSKLAYRRVAAGAVITAAMLSASPAIAGRCGYSYAVDSPTTLSKVARACNVSFAALVEANRGVDPGYVRPGEHLAVPDEVDNPQDAVAPDPDAPSVDTSPAAPVVRHPYIATRPLNTQRRYDASYETSYETQRRYEYYDGYYNDDGRHYDDYYHDDGRSDFRPINASARAPATYFGISAAPVETRRDSRLSYQKLSASRIRNAGYAAQPQITPRSVYWDNPAQIRTVSAYPTPIMECSVLRRQPNGKIQQVRELRPAPELEHQETPAHCASVKLGKPASAIMTRSAFAQNLPQEFAVLRGRVVSVDFGCMTLQGDDGLHWRINAPQSASDMFGKEATVWAAPTRDQSCGGLMLDHAVYAEKL
ncbi:LysM peptidoglycan-binding domain-containing protein [Hyphococcus sp.]|uniref:LysM peptidoglycan-binding domain-containing protein n=1 Tax=Hyphococcus sp. TaxID=2038636 RepID=UPI003CCB9558